MRESDAQAQSPSVDLDEGSVRDAKLRCGGRSVTPGRSCRWLPAPNPTDRSVGHPRSAVQWLTVRLRPGRLGAVEKAAKGRVGQHSRPPYEVRDPEPVRVREDDDRHGGGRDAHEGGQIPSIDPPWLSILSPWCRRMEIPHASWAIRPFGRPRSPSISGLRREAGSQASHRARSARLVTRPPSPQQVNWMSTR